jgi:hypothetical protein
MYSHIASQVPSKRTPSLHGCAFASSRTCTPLLLHDTPEDSCASSIQLLGVTSYSTYLGLLLSGRGFPPLIHFFTQFPHRKNRRLVLRSKYHSSFTPSTSTSSAFAKYERYEISWGPSQDVAGPEWCHERRDVDAGCARHVVRWRTPLYSTLHCPQRWVG